MKIFESLYLVHTSAPSLRCD